MADFTAGPDGADDGIPAGTFVNLIAGAVSLALICGVGVWGYKLLVRDVTGVPVVRALAGDMRVAPENPGGEIAAHVGLSVNDVPAIGGAAEPEDRLILAPNTSSLMAEDMEAAPAPTIAEANEIVPDATPDAPVDRLGVEVAAALTVPPQDNVDPAAPLSAEDVLALADRVAAGAAATATLSDDEATAAEDAALEPAAMLAAMPGVRQSPRPPSRPSNLARPVPAAAATATPAATTAVVNAVVRSTPVPVGTKMVQLGAFESAEIAAGEWVRLTSRYEGVFDGKDQIIQQATSGGRTFFRLRALGFEELSEARDFCADLSAQGAACIPVVMR